MKTFQCHITKKSLPENELVQGKYIRKNILDLIQKDHPDFKKDEYVSILELNKYRDIYLEHILKQEMGELTKLEEDVIKSISGNALLSFNIEPEIDKKITYGERLSDKIAEFGGSWTFIIAFFSFLLVWIGVNIWVFTQKPFDPYPFILLNLILSCLAAIQAPIIMMSQNRKEDKDRRRSEHDYKINLKAELEIRLLNERIEHIISHQNQMLIEIQQLQVDMMEDILKKLKA